MENPLSKLHILLEQAYEESRSPINIPSFKDTWSKVFEIDPSDNFALINSMSSMLNLLVTSKRYIETHDTLNIDKNIEFLNKIESALSSLNFDGDMSHFQKYIDSETLTALFYMSLHLGMVYDFEKIKLTNENISELIVDVNNLMEKVAVSSLSQEVISILTRNLESIRSSLLSYKISGNEGMLAAMEQTVGSLRINEDKLIEVVDDEISMGFFGIINKLNSLLSTGISVKELMAPLIDFIKNK